MVSATRILNVRPKALNLTTYANVKCIFGSVLLFLSIVADCWSDKKVQELGVTKISSGLVYVFSFLLTAVSIIVRSTAAVGLNNQIFPTEASANASQGKGETLIYVNDSGKTCSIFRWFNLQATTVLVPQTFDLC